MALISGPAACRDPCTHQNNYSSRMLRGGDQLYGPRNDDLVGSELLDPERKRCQWKL